MKYVRFSMLVLILTSCVSTRVFHDYDELKDFSAYETFDFYPKMNLSINDLDRKRLLTVTEEALQNKGLVKSETPDIYINFNTALFEENSQSSIGVGVGSIGRGGGIAVGGAIPIGGSEIFLELTIDFVDVQEDALVWQAIAEKRYNPNDSPNAKSYVYRAMIEKALSKYPPQPK